MGDKNYGIELAAQFTNKNGPYHDGYKVKYVPQNDIHSDTIDELIYNSIIDLSEISKKRFLWFKLHKIRFFLMKINMFTILVFNI